MCVVSLPVGQQPGTAHEISERVRETNKIKIVAAASLDGITRKWMLELHDQIFSISST